MSEIIKKSKNSKEEELIKNNNDPGNEHLLRQMDESRGNTNLGGTNDSNLPESAISGTNSQRDRSIRILCTKKKDSDNAISTNKYTAMTFIPLNLFEQFSKPANLYFLCIAVLQCIPDVSTTEQIPTILIPLSFVLLLTAIKDLFEDLKRFKSDKEENNSETTVLIESELKPTRWKNLKPGNVVHLRKDQSVPADLLLIYSGNNSKKVAYVETKNLDGETNLKQVTQVNFTDQNPDAIPIETVMDLKRTKITFERENANLSSFSGIMNYKQENLHLSISNLLLRGCTLKNTDYVYGVVISAGHKTKIMQNSVKSKMKKSHLEIKTGRWVILIFLIEVVLCLFAALYHIIFLSFQQSSFQNWINYDTMNMIVLFFTRLGNWMLIFGFFK